MSLVNKLFYFAKLLDEVPIMEYKRLRYEDYFTICSDN